MSDEMKLLSVGAGFMGTLHAKACEQIEGVRNVGIVTRNYTSSEKLADILGGDIPRFTNFEEALEKTAPDAVAISTYTDSHYHDTLHNIMQVQSPIVDCGVHYVDIMYQMAQCRPVRVHAIGCRNWDLVPEHICNYGQLQVEFEDGSVGWYEAGWGPMMSETAYFIKDVAGPAGAASICPGKGRSDDKDHHVEANTIIRHYAEQKDKEFVREDEVINIDEPDLDGLVLLEQQAFVGCIRNDTDMSSHQDRVMTSLRIVFAADQSQKTKQVVEL